MVIATFGPTSELTGTKITHDGYTFMLEGHGTISAADIIDFDREGHLIWEAASTRAWVEAKMPSPPPVVPAPPAAQPAAVVPLVPAADFSDVKLATGPSDRTVPQQTPGEFLRFRWMITPMAIQVVFWLGLVVVLVMSIIFMSRGGFSILVGVLLLIVGSLMVRISCELTILLFRIYESLRSIEKGSARAA